MTRQALILAAGAAPLLAPAAALATGREMAPIVLSMFLFGVGGMVLLQFLTLLAESLLPREWSRARRWLLAIVLPPLLLAVVALLVTLLL